MHPPLPRTDPAPLPPDAPAPDFANDLFIADKPGAEFAAMRRDRILAPAIGGMLFIPAIGCSALLYLVLTDVLSVPRVAAYLVCSAVAGVAMLFLTAHQSRAGVASWKGFASLRATDSRYRVRAVIPRNRQTPRMGRWAMLATGIEPDHYPATPDEFAAVRGGFEPVVLRPWLGIARPAPYRRVLWTTALAGTALIVAFTLSRTGSLLPMVQTLRLWGVFAIVAALAIGAAESLFPAYLRLAPGRLDVFRYPLLGRGPPRVTTYDLRVTPICVDFQTATIALEPPLPPGQALPKTVTSPRWPHWKELPPDCRPDLVCVALCPGRTEFCQRLIQAARTAEPTPPLPADRLLG